MFKCDVLRKYLIDKDMPSLIPDSSWYVIYDTSVGE